MKPHTKAYFRSRNLSPADTVFCEICGAVACDIHHIQPKGMGGSIGKDVPENLIGLCRDCHNKAHKSKFLKEMLFEIARRRICES